MGKNKSNRKNLKGNLKIYCQYKVSGYNLDRLINILQRKGIELYDVVKKSSHEMTLSVSYYKCEKFFAITKELCYNVVKQRERGRDYPLLLMWRNLGVVIGALLFTLIAFLADDYIFSFSYTGSGSIYSQQVTEYLYDMGIKPLTRFSELDVRKLGNSILACNDNLSFVSCHKKGNRLMIDMAVAENHKLPQDTDKKEIISAYDGVIESIKIYSGKSRFKAGDKVVKGDILIDGLPLADGGKEDAVGIIKLKVTNTYSYVSHKKGEEEIATIFAEENFYNREITETRVITERKKGQYHYTVSADYIVMVS